MTEVLIAPEVPTFTALELGALMTSPEVEVDPAILPRMACGNCPGAAESQDTSNCSGPQEWTHDGTTYRQCGAPYKYE